MEKLITSGINQFGMLIVILRGEDAERKKALEYISKNVYKLERLGGR